MKIWLCAAVAASGLLATGLSALSGSGEGNGVIGQLNGEGGDPALGAALYSQRCAACHDYAGGRIPPKASIADNTRASITTTLFAGVMQPMARGLSLHDLASIATYLSSRKDGTAGGFGPDAPACAAKPKPLDLSGNGAWNGWGRTMEQARYQPNPGFTAAEVSPPQTEVGLRLLKREQRPGNGGWRPAVRQFFFGCNLRARCQNGLHVLALRRAGGVAEYDRSRSVSRRAGARCRLLYGLHPVRVRLGRR